MVPRSPVAGAVVVCAAMIVLAMIAAVFLLLPGREDAPSAAGLPENRIAQPPTVAAGQEDGRSDQAELNADFVDAGIERLAPQPPARLGPPAGAAAWCGTLFNVEGAAIPHARISLRRIRSHSPRATADRVTDQDGRFRFEGLAPGLYGIDLWLPAQMMSGWGDINFGAADLVQRDIRLQGGAIAGVVIDEATGRLLEADPGRWPPVLHAVKTDDGCRVLKYCTLWHGRFRIESLPAGTYDVSLSGSDVVSLQVHGVEVADGQVTDEIRMTVPRRGVLHMEFEGLFEEATAALFRDRETAPFCEKRWFFDVHGSSTLSMGVPVGIWTVQVSSIHDGAVAHGFEMHEGETARFTVARSDFENQDGLITLEGRMTWGGARPLSNSHLVFAARIAGPAGEYDREIRGRTDGDGRFCIKGFTPGAWSVGLDDPTYSDPVMDVGEITVPDLATASYPCDIDVGAGSIKGAIFDGATGKLLSQKDAQLKLQLVAAASGKQRVELGRRSDASQFEMKIAPPGDYRLHVEADPYEDFISDAFALHAGETSDFGPIRLYRAATFSLKFLDTAGNVVDTSSYDFEGDVEPRRYWLPTDSRPVFPRPDPVTVWMVPRPGPVTVSVQPFGYKKTKATFSVPSGDYREIVIALEPR